MKRFKLTWDERVLDEEGDFLHFQQKSQVIEAENEDAACAQWEKENQHNDNQTGLDNCVEIVEHELFSKHLVVSMPDGFDYAVPVEVIARHRAEYYAHKDYNGDITKSLVEDTLPLFQADRDEIREWASNNMNWTDVEDSAKLLKKRVEKVDYQDAWVNGEWKIL